jgi:serine phosphatase RsbU (regulator of sigma subunit)
MWRLELERKQGGGNGFRASLDKRFRYRNAGHPYPILVSSGAVRMLDQGGAVLGVFPAWTYQDSSVNLSSGDRLLLFIDGITEAEGSTLT